MAGSHDLKKGSHNIHETGTRNKN